MRQPYLSASPIQQRQLKMPQQKYHKFNLTILNHPIPDLLDKKKGASIS